MYPTIRQRLNLLLLQQHQHVVPAILWRERRLLSRGASPRLIRISARERDLLSEAGLSGMKLFKMRRKSMNSTTLRTMLLSFAIIAAGCAGAKVTEQSSQASIANVRPAAVVIYPFAVSPSEVTMNQGFFQKAYVTMSGADQTDQQVQLAHQTAQNVCVQVAANLTNKGITTTCLNRGTPPTGSNILIIDGNFTDINEGNRLRR